MVARIRIAKNGGGGNYFAAPKKQIEFISSGGKTLDLALGGGWAEGRIGNIVGDQSTGKTLLCIEAAANFALKHARGEIKYREAEAAFDNAYAAALGLPIDRVDFSALDTVEDLFEDLNAVIKDATKYPILYICDSLDALSDRAEMDRTMDQGTFGAEKAKKLSQLFRRLVRQLSRTKLTLLIVSQVRSKIGLSFGRTTTRTGGRALDFYASQVLYLSHIGTVKKTISGITRPVGIEVRAKVDKNKVGLPLRQEDFSIRFGFGIDDMTSCLEWLSKARFLKDIGLKVDRDIKSYVTDLMQSPNSEYRKELQRIHEAVERRWWEVEKDFLPPRSKYVEA